MYLAGLGERIVDIEEEDSGLVWTLVERWVDGRCESHVDMFMFAVSLSLSRCTIGEGEQEVLVLSKYLRNCTCVVKLGKGAMAQLGALFWRHY